MRWAAWWGPKGPASEEYTMKLLIAAVCVMGMIAGSGGAMGQSKKWRQDCVDLQNCPPQELQEGEDDSAGGRRKKSDQLDSQRSGPPLPKRRVQENSNEAAEEVSPSRKESLRTHSAWQFDPKKHERRRKKDDRFRFEFGGFWYSEPYWWYDYDYGRVYRVSCSEGRLALLERGFRRVRPINCRGRTYTYLARRAGDTFRILLHSRTGRILSVRPI
jgi:hypothetical protein